MTVGISLPSPLNPLAPVCGLLSKSNGPHWNLVILSTGFRGSSWSTWSRSEECFLPPFSVSLRWENHFLDVSLTFLLWKMESLGWKQPWVQHSKSSCVRPPSQPEETNRPQEPSIPEAPIYTLLALPLRAQEVGGWALLSFPLTDSKDGVPEREVMCSVSQGWDPGSFLSVSHLSAMSNARLCGRTLQSVWSFCPWVFFVCLFVLFFFKAWLWRVWETKRGAKISHIVNSPFICQSDSSYSMSALLVFWGEGRGLGSKSEVIVWAPPPL